MINANETNQIAGFPPHVVAVVDELTRADRQLYFAALARFRRDLRQVEEAFGVRLLCGEAT